MNTEDLDNLTKRFASEVAEFEREKDYINGGFVVGLFRKYLIEAEKEAWNAAIDAAAEEAMLEIKDSKGVEIWSIVDAEIEGQFISSRITVSKESILNLKK